MSENNRARIGIMGGTFDPIHIGHLILGETAYEQFHLDKVLFMPAGNPPHKKNRRGRATDEERVEMVRRAISGNEHFELSLIEMNEDGYTYTYRTLERMQQREKTRITTLSSGQILYIILKPGWSLHASARLPGLWSRHAIIQKRKVWTVKCIVYLSNTTAHS